MAHRQRDRPQQALPSEYLLSYDNPLRPWLLMMCLHLSSPCPQQHQNENQHCAVQRCVIDVIDGLETSLGCA